MPNWKPIDPPRVLIKAQRSKPWSPREWCVEIETIDGSIVLITSDSNFDPERQVLRAFPLATDGPNVLVSLPDLPFNAGQQVGVPKTSLADGSRVA